jgi:hypothetical protein
MKRSGSRWLGMRIPRMRIAWIVSCRGIMRDDRRNEGDRWEEHGDEMVVLMVVKLLTVS